MNRILFILITLLFFAISCKKENDNSTPVSNNTIVLNEPQLMGDSILLTWTVGQPNQFKSIRITRNSGEMAPTFFYVDVNSNKYVDHDVPYCQNVSYGITGIVDNGYYHSNSFIYNRPEIGDYAIVPFDIKHSDDNRFIYVFESDGKISQYDLEKDSIIKVVNIGVPIGYCDFGTYNGVKELYVPTSSAAIQIYNAQTMERIKVIDLNTGNLNNVVANNNLLFVSSFSNTDNYLITLNRQTESIVYQQKTVKINYLKRYKDNENNLLAITDLGTFMKNIASFQFNNTGDSAVSDSNSYQYTLGKYNFPLEASPSGNYILSSVKGNLIEKNLTVSKSLPTGNFNFTSFYFDEVNNQILASTTSKTIEVYDMTTFQFIKSIATKSYPLHIVKYKNNLICVGSLYEFTTYPIRKITVEKIKN